MKPQRALQAETGVKVTVVDKAEQAKRIHAAIAQRAYELFESHGRQCGHELEDWEEARAATLGALDFGLTLRDHEMLLGADVADFAPDSLFVWAAPGRLTLCGRPLANRMPAATDRDGEHMIFREIPVRAAFNPYGVKAKLRGRFLEIMLPLAGWAEQVRAVAA